MTSTGSVRSITMLVLVVLCWVSHVTGDGLWDQWSDFSPCSRTCGGGVQARTRGCIHKGSGKGMGCVGPDHEYSSCDTDPCPRDSEDFRSMQCAKFNHLPMILNGQAKTYDWVPHFDEKNRCALKCHALGTAVVRQLEDMVTDGTQCDSPEHFGICVGGVCQTVGCDRVIGSVMEEDRCRVCGGDGSACLTEKGAFTQDNLNVGYHEVLTIPEGSTSITIREMKPSHSYLGLKNARGMYYINGGRDRTSQKAVAGTIFQYYSAESKDDKVESILSRGPTNETLIVMLVARDGNPGVRFEYSSPQSLVDKANPTDRFTWVYGQWTGCSAECGTGYQLRAVSCMDRQSGGTVNMRSCDLLERPRANQTCNMGSCAEDRTNGYSWVLGHWDECSVSCGVGEQTQLAYCQEKGTMGQTIFVSDDICLRYLGEKPEYKRVCEGESGCPQWATGAWNECGVTCGYGYQTRRVYCQRDSDGEDPTVVPNSECKLADKPKDRKRCLLSSCHGGRDGTLKELEGRPISPLPVQCSATRYGCCPDGVTAAQGPKYRNCPVARKTDRCKLERSRGPCANYTLKWYYDDQASMCNMFWYGGCGGNDNRFEKEDECESTCVTNDGTGGAPCSPGSSRCRNIEKCIPDARLCDGFNDCGDNSDEEQCQTIDANKQCGTGQSMCSSIRKCVADSQRCDGHDDCGDNSDEDGCQSTDTNKNPCGRGRSMCRSVRKCVADSQRCDGRDDCGDNSDEENCQTEIEDTNKNPCGRGRSMCRSVRKCVADSQRCDGRDDCGDNSDEENCGTDTEESHTNPCGTGSSMCRGVKKCVADSERCDGYDDCGDNSDEENCVDSINTCQDGSSMCRSIKKCVADVRRCDGYDDCGDNSDEENCDDDNQIVSIDCGTSTHGCCPDGQTSASGPNQEGCPNGGNPGGRECRRSRYGCCPDRVTPASGPHNYGCEGDGCERSAYGCCPDSKTKATGPNHQGCSSGHGSFDPASCGLPQEKGDCSDYSAQWYFSMEMGTCSQFWYGGCGGNTNRFNNQSDCEKSCVHVKGPGACRLPKAKGPCKASKPRYYFHHHSGECKKFTYGGCRGNANRYHSKADCERKCSDSTYIDSEDDDGPTKSLCLSSRYGCCPDGRTPATGANNAGCPAPCQSSQYGCCDDGVTSAQGPKMYGCEVGSGREPCENTQYGCCSDGVTAATGYNQEGCDEDVIIGVETTKVSAGNLDPCSQDKDSNRCKDFVVKWYWDRDSKRCDRFWFGGCDGNMNRFDSEEECLGRCKNSTGKTSSVDVNKCQQPRAKGSCRAELTRWYFDTYSQRCMAFLYGGCQGNDNNFLSERECQRQCGGRVATPAPTFAPPTTTTTESPGVKPEKSSMLMTGQDYVKVGRHIRVKCDATTMSSGSSRIIEWFKDGNRISTDTGSSRMGITLALNGYLMVSEMTIKNADKSDSGMYYCRSLPDGDVKSMAVKVVDASFGVTASPRTTTTTPYPEEYFTTRAPRPSQPRDVCIQEAKAGQCYASIPKWYYDYSSGVCREFSYGGCNGNENNFNTKEECDSFCRPQEICILPYETGPCRALIARWAYDSTSNECQEFNYGGCSGNPNNFESKESCERRCRSRSPDHSMGGDVCSLPRAGGTCDGYDILWYYDTSRSRCNRFIYTGCAGNGNRFGSEAECQAACEGHPGTLAPVVRTTTPAPRVKASALCDQRPDSARCDNSNDPSDYEIKWYYDSERGVCTRFYYGGCGGNENRFDNRPDCQSRCVYGRQVKTTPYPALLTTAAPLNCRHSVYGCCKDGYTTAEDEYHSNCDDGPNVIERRKGEDYEILVRPDKDVLINCRIHRTDRDIVTWYRDRFVVQTGYRFTLFNNGSLWIKNIKEDDTGIYSCQVARGNDVPQIERYNVQVRVPLRILPSPKVIKIRPGDNAFLHCQVYGQPTPTITWLKNGRPVMSTGHFRAFENGTLIIMQTQDYDAGQYECQAENGVSTMAKKQVQLIIRENSGVCEDKLPMMKCKMIRTARLCGHRRFSKMCCASCKHQRFR